MPFGQRLIRRIEEEGCGRTEIDQILRRCRSTFRKRMVEVNSFYSIVRYSTVLQHHADWVGRVSLAVER